MFIRILPHIPGNIYLYTVIIDTIINILITHTHEITFIGSPIRLLLCYIFDYTVA